jgi:hypothetical protein
MKSLYERGNEVKSLTERRRGSEVKGNEGERKEVTIESHE